MSECKIAEAVRKMLEYTHPGKLKETLTELWEGWLTNDDTDTATSAERSEKLMAYKTLAQFLEKLEHV